MEFLVPGGFGDRGVEGKISAIRYARENKIPYLGICLGMQLAVIEFARNVANLKGAHSSELNSSNRLSSNRFDARAKGYRYSWRNHEIRFISMQN